MKRPQHVHLKILQLVDILMVFVEDSSTDVCVPVEQASCSRPASCESC